MSYAYILEGPTILVCEYLIQSIQSVGIWQGVMASAEVGSCGQRWAGGALAIFYTATEVGAYVPQYVGT